jgi:hypothetical protein
MTKKLTLPALEPVEACCLLPTPKPGEWGESDVRALLAKELESLPFCSLSVLAGRVRALGEFARSAGFPELEQEMHEELGLLWVRFLSAPEKSTLAAALTIGRQMRPTDLARLLALGASQLTTLVRRPEYVVVECPKCRLCYVPSAVSVPPVLDCPNCARVLAEAKLRAHYVQKRSLAPPPQPASTHTRASPE